MRSYPTYLEVRQTANLSCVLGVTPGSQSSGEWDSIHVFEATDRARSSHYKLTSTVILHLANQSEALGDMDLSGNMTRQVEADLPVEQGDASHIANVGRLVEDMELKMRNLLRMSYHLGRELDLENANQIAFCRGGLLRQGQGRCW